MDAHHFFRKLCTFCCIISILLIGSAAFRYEAQHRWVEQMNTPENVAQFGAVQFRAPLAVSNTLLIAGLFMALAGCFWLKAAKVRPAEVRSAPIADENEVD